MFALMTRSGDGVQSASLMSISAFPLHSARWGIELRVLRLQPRLVVVRIFYRQRRLRDLERMEAVHHYRQLVGVLGSDARFRASGMRTVGNSVRMMRDASELDPLATHEFTRGIVENFVGIDVAVIIGRRNGFRMEIVGPWAK